MIGIYKIENLINGKIYIGQSQHIQRRWKEHKNFSYSPEFLSRPLYQDFLKYGVNNFNFTVIEECTSDKLDEREQYWIKYYNSCYYATNSNGYNLNYGGGKYHTKSDEEQKEMIKLWDKGLSTSQIGKKLSCTKSTIRHYLKDNCKTYTIKEGKERGKIIRELGKKINQYNLEGHFIKQFKNGVQAAKENNINYSSIKRAASGKYFQAGGYIYIYDEENQEQALKSRFDLLSESKEKNKNCHKVEQYDLDTGKTIAIFNSYTAAAKTLFYPAARRYIGECCNGIRKEYKGYGWRNKND